METGVIILANGFEEIEAVAVIDILRRAEVNLTIAGLDSLSITSARNLKITTDITLSELQDSLFDIIILPGGEPGTTHLENSPLVTELLIKHAKANKLLAAICAAPRVLEKTGLLTNKKITCFPKTIEKMKTSLYQPNSVVIDDKIITSQGAGTSLEFAYAIVEKLKSKECAENLKKSMIYK